VIRSNWRVNGKRQDGGRQAILESEVSATAVAAVPRLPQRSGDSQLFERSAGGDRCAREELVSRFLPLARRLALRYSRRGESPDDLVQVASMGLVKAVERFDHRRGAPFQSYAVPTIDGELKRYLRDTSWAAHVPQRMRERVFVVERATETLRHKLGRSPTSAEVAEHLGLEVTDVLEAGEAATAYTATSLDAPLHDDDMSSRAESLGSEEARYELVEYTAMLAPAIRALPARQRVILRLRFEHDMTQCEIAQIMGISQMHVSRMLRQALARLRAVVRARQVPAAAG
jgi:RNA polymerase sigma-B factor